MHTSQLLDQILTDFFESKNHVLNNLYNSKYQEIPFSQFMSAIKILFNETLLEYEVNKSNTAITEWTILAISLNGRTVIEKGGYKKVYDSLTAKKEEKENLELQKLRSENIKLVNDLADYPKIKIQRNVLFWVAILQLILLLAKYML